MAAVGVGDPARAGAPHRHRPPALALSDDPLAELIPPSAAAWRSRPPAAAVTGCRSTTPPHRRCRRADLFLEHDALAGLGLREPRRRVFRPPDAAVAQLGGLARSPSRSARSASPRSVSSCSLNSRTTSMAFFSFCHLVVSSASFSFWSASSALAFSSRSGGGVLFLLQCHLLDLQAAHGARPRRPRRAGSRSPSQPGGGLVDKVDRLVRQEPAGDVAVGQGGGGHQRGVGDAHAVVHLVRSDRPRRMPTVSSTDGSPTNTCWKRRSSAASFSMYLRYSSSVVAPTRRSSPRASMGLIMLPASIAPSPVAPAPTMVCISSMKVMICPADSDLVGTALRRSSNSPRYFRPATMDPRSSEMTVLSRRLSGTSPSMMRCARPSTIAVLPTPGSPISTGLFLVRRLRT